MREKSTDELDGRAGGGGREAIRALFNTFGEWDCEEVGDDESLPVDNHERSDRKLISEGGEGEKREAKEGEKRVRRVRCVGKRTGR